MFFRVYVAEGDVSSGTRVAAETDHPLIHRSSDVVDGGNGHERLGVGQVADDPDLDALVVIGLLHVKFDFNVLNVYAGFKFRHGEERERIQKQGVVPVVGEYGFHEHLRSTEFRLRHRLVLRHHRPARRFHKGTAIGRVGGRVPLKPLRHIQLCRGNGREAVVN